MPDAKKRFVKPGGVLTGIALDVAFDHFHEKLILHIGKS